MIRISMSHFAVRGLMPRLRTAKRGLALLLIVRSRLCPRLLTTLLNPMLASMAAYTVFLASGGKDKVEPACVDFMISILAW